MAALYPRSGAQGASTSGARRGGKRGSISFVGTHAQKSRRRIPRIEHELWHVFTHYTIHSDPCFPGAMRASAFLSLVRDCTLLEPRVATNEVDLLILRQTSTKHKSRNSKSNGHEGAEISRNKNSNTLRAGNGRNSNDANGSSPGVRGNAWQSAAPSQKPTATSLTFSEFLRVLRNLSPRVYPESPPHIAFKRLVLEDVLLLAKRRDVSVRKRTFTDVRTLDLMHERLGGAWKELYAFYTNALDLGVRDGARRSGGQGDTGEDVSGPAMTYDAFMAFAKDMKLVGGQGAEALVSATECAELYLASAPLYESIDHAIPTIDQAGFVRLIAEVALHWTEKLILGEDSTKPHPKRTPPPRQTPAPSSAAAAATSPAAAPHTMHIPNNATPATPCTPPDGDPGYTRTQTARAVAARIKARKRKLESVPVIHRVKALLLHFLRTILAQQSAAREARGPAGNSGAFRSPESSLNAATDRGKGAARFLKVMGSIWAEDEYTEYASSFTAQHLPARPERSSPHVQAWGLARTPPSSGRRPHSTPASGTSSHGSADTHTPTSRRGMLPLGHFSGGGGAETPEGVVRQVLGLNQHGQRVSAPTGSVALSLDAHMLEEHDEYDSPTGDWGEEPNSGSGSALGLGNEPTAPGELILRVSELRELFNTNPGVSDVVATCLSIARDYRRSAGSLYDGGPKAPGTRTTATTVSPQRYRKGQ